MFRWLFIGRSLGGRYHSWRMDALKKGRGLRGRYHSWAMDAHGGPTDATGNGFLDWGTMRSGWTLFSFWPMDTLENGWGLDGITRRLTHGCSGRRRRPGWDSVTVDPWRICGKKDERSRWMLSWLSHGCSGGRMMSGWTLSWLWPMDALGNG